jgi:hypothetical protein
MYGTMFAFVSITGHGSSSDIRISYVSLRKDVHECGE